MKVAILSCGPSVGLFQQFSKPYDLVMGINDVVTDFNVDWWVFKDANIFADYTPSTLPEGICSLGTLEGTHYPDLDENGGLTHRDFLPENVSLRKRVAYRNIGDWEFNGFRGMGNKSPDIWKRWTITTALMLAYQFGATEIDIYGADMKGDANYAGRTGRRDTDRDDNRWEHERESLAFVTGWLEERGISVVRMKP